MEDLVELTSTGIDYVADKHGDKIYDSVKRQKDKRFGPGRKNTNSSAGQGNVAAPRNSQQRQRRGSDAVSATTSRGAYRHRNSLPSPEREDKTTADYTYRRPRDDSLERESQRSAQVLRAYENERDDPRRDPYQTLGTAAIPATAGAAAAAAAVPPSAYGDTRDLSPKDTGRRPGTQRNMSAYQSGYDRPRSQPPPNSRYYYDDDEYGSDYDDRTGNRYRSSGRGYRDDDRDVENGEPYREYVETERYRGPARGFQSQFRGPDGAYGGPPAPGSAAAAGAIAPYRRRDSRTDVSSRRSKSRDRRRDSRSRSISSERSRGEGGKHKIEEWFDPSPKGIGIGIAGAVVGGFAGRKLGGGERGEHHQRDMLLGAVIGGLAANAVEKKVREYRHPDERRDGRREVYEYDDGGRRPRSSVR